MDLIYSYEILAVIIAALILIEILILKISNKNFLFIKKSIDKLFNKNINLNIIIDIIISGIYIIAGLMFSLYIKMQFGTNEMWRYLVGFNIEFMLSVDNLFMIMLIFKSFNIQSIPHKKLVLHVGLISAVIMRFLIINQGIDILLEFKWMMKVFAIIVIYLGIKLIVTIQNHKKNFSKNKLYILLKNKFDIQDTDQSFFQKNNNNKTRITTLFVALILIEVTDLIFALDSVPAILLVTQNIFVVYSANIFAILGLRSLYNLLEFFLNKLKYINKIIGAILISLGIKMLL
ncbi:MAG: hypothetical protein U1E31_02490 [Rickettsiales bacterium]